MGMIKCPPPVHLLKVGVVEARGLEGKDWSLFGKATSDPYAVIRIGERSHKTPVIDRTLTPQWGTGGWADFLMYSRDQLVTLDVVDSDLMPGGDDHLGNLWNRRVLDIVQNPDKWWPLTERLSSPDEEAKTAGEVRLVCQVFDISADPTSITTPIQDLTGGAKAIALFAMQFRCLRGLSATKAVGAKLSVELEGATVETLPSEFLPPTKTYCTLDKVVEVDICAQRMVEYMHQEKKTLEEIAAISGLSKNIISKIVSQKPSFTARWDQIVRVPLNDPMSAQVKVKLNITSEGSGVHAEQEGTFAIKQLLDEEHMTTDCILTLRRSKQNSNSRSREKEDSPGPFELDVRFTLRGLRRSHETYSNEASQ